MAAGLGIAAGAFAQNYAQAMGLRSRLDSEKQQQEANAIKLEQARQFQADQKALADMQRQFWDTDNFDFVGGKAYDPPPAGGITPPDAPKRVKNPYEDQARVDAYYDRTLPLLERQALAAGKNPAIVREELQDLRRKRFVENTGNALALIEAGDPSGFNLLKNVSKALGGGVQIAGGRFNEDGSVTLSYNKDGEVSERVVPMEKLMEYGKLGLSLADATKLRTQIFENREQRKFTRDERLGRQDYETGERIAGQGFRRSERLETQDYQTGERLGSEGFRTRERLDAQNYELPFKQGALGVARQNAESSRISATATARKADADVETSRFVRQSAADSKAEGAAQKFFDNAFGTSEFKVKTDDEVKALTKKQREAYEVARVKQAERMARRNEATNLWDLNDRKLAPSFITSALPIIEERIRSGKGADGTDPGTGLPYVNINGKKVLLPKD